MRIDGMLCLEPPLDVFAQAISEITVELRESAVK